MVNISIKDLSKLKIFSGIDLKTIEDILSSSSTEKYQTGDTIIKEGDNSNGKGYIIASGEVDVIIGGNIVANLVHGDIFGEIALLNEEERTATIIAKSPIEVLVLSQENLINMINNEDSIINNEIVERMEENLKREEVA